MMDAEALEISRWKLEALRKRRDSLGKIYAELEARLAAAAGPVEQLTFNRDTLTGGLARLPVTW